MVLSANVLRYSDSGRSKGSGLVDFATAEEAARARSDLNETNLDGRTIFVREDRGDVPPARTGGTAPARRAPAARRTAPRAAPTGTTSSAAPRTPSTPGTTAYVGNLPWSVNRQGLKDLFVDFTPLSADVKMRDGRSAGWGTVRFGSTDDCERAITSLNGADVEGRSISVRVFKED
jgi:RNA recognition motif-containing protein